MISRIKRLAVTSLLVTPVALGACSRVIIATGTTIGLKATPGDGETRPPQVTLGYKRAEIALVPTNEGKSTHHDPAAAGDVDALSTLAAFFMSTEWFGDTRVQSFIATGHAAQELQPKRGSNTSTTFNSAFAQATLQMLPEEIRTRRRALSDKVSGLNDAAVANVLTLTGCTRPGMNPGETLDDCIKAAQTDIELQKLESAVARSQ